MYKILVVDDEPITRMDISAMLADLGYEVCGEAGDGFDAVEMCRKLRPDIVMMDVKMPIFDGLKATKTITDEDLAGCVILLTAYSDKETVEGATEAGAAGYIVKPVDSRTIMPTIEVAMAQSQKLRESRKEKADADSKLSSAKIVEQAKGILARQQGISETDAYKQLRKMAMDKRVQLAVLAQRIVENEKM